MNKYLTPALVQQLSSGVQRFDAGETAVVARSLEHVEQQVLETMFAELRSLRYFPTIPGIDAGATLYTWYRMNYAGEAARTGDRGKDLPRVDLQLVSQYSNIASYGAAYGYTVSELRQIALAAKNGLNVQLDTMRASKAAEVIARKIDSVVAFGDPEDSTISGVINNAEVIASSHTVAGTAWADLAEPSDLLDELFLLANVNLIASKEAIQADTILLPTAQFLQVQRTPIGANADRSVLSYFMQSMTDSQRMMNVASWPLLNTGNGSGGTRAVAYKRDVSIVGAIVPMPFQSQPPQPEGLEFVIPCEGLCGGGVVKQPLGMYYRDGV